MRQAEASEILNETYHCCQDGFWISQNKFPKSVEETLNEVLELTQAARYERNEQRQG